jgi:hypothetical protein
VSIYLFCKRSSPYFFHPHNYIKSHKNRLELASIFFLEALAYTTHTFTPSRLHWRTKTLCFQTTILTSSEPKRGAVAVFPTRSTLLLQNTKTPQHEPSKSPIPTHFPTESYSLRKPNLLPHNINEPRRGRGQTSPGERAGRNFFFFL